jgi:hypothetical protein
VTYFPPIRAYYDARPSMFGKQTDSLRTTEPRARFGVTNREQAGKVRGGWCGRERELRGAAWRQRAVSSQSTAHPAGRVFMTVCVIEYNETTSDAFSVLDVHVLRRVAAEQELCSIVTPIHGSVCLPPRRVHVW